jgi:hypothetical protein
MAIKQMRRLRAQGRSLRAIAKAVQAKGHRISHEGVAGMAPSLRRFGAICRGNLMQNRRHLGANP